jgi:membrane-associated phospholipid phosphatase
MTATTEGRPPGPLVPPANLRRELVLVASGLVLVLLCGLIARNGRVGEPERAVFRAVNELPGWLYPVLWPIQQLGNLVAGPAIALVAALFRRWRLALGALIVSFVDLEPIVKSLVVRERPGTTVPDAVLRGDVPAAGQSFPSGHAVLIASLAVIAAPYFRGRWRLVPWVLVAGVCIGRVYVGAHNPVDVIAGCGLGLVIGGIVSILVHLPIGPHPALRSSSAEPRPSPVLDRRPQAHQDRRDECRTSVAPVTPNVTCGCPVGYELWLASLNWRSTSPGIRPRLGTLIPWATAHARIAFGSRLAFLDRDAAGLRLRPAWVPAETGRPAAQ